MSSSSIYGSAAAPVTISGIATGINTSSIITQLTQNETNAETQYQNQETTINSALTEWQTFNGTLTGLQSIAQSLSQASTFDTSQATIDQSNVASITTSPGAASGNHTLTVTGLAQSQSVLSTGVSDSTVPLGYSGSFILNGTQINVASTDTMSSLATKINNANAGVNASVISAGTGNYQLSLAAGNTGTINSISASDVGSGTVLESLGLIPGATATIGLRQTVTNGNGETGAGSIAFSNSNQSIGTLMGISSGQASSGTVTIGGTQVSLNLNSMSLTDVANAINSAGIPNVQAQIVGIPNSSGQVTASSGRQLQIVSTSSGQPITASSFTDSGGVLASLGIVQKGYTDQVAAASDAQFAVDGISYTRSTNTISDVLPNVTMTLNSQTDGTPANISITQDTSDVSTMIGNFVTAYNGVIDAINQQNTYSGTTSAGGTDTSSSTPPLFGNMTLMDIQNQLANMVDVSSGSQTLAGIGITVNASGELQVDSSQLQSALSSNPQQVADLFSAFGSSTNSDISFVSAGSSTVSSSSQGYNVDISQAATQAIATAASPFQTLTQAETLTFAGGLFGSASTSITLPSGSTIQSAISAINGNTNLSQYLYASQNSNGELVLSSKGFGSNQSFSVNSSTSGAGTSGIGTTAINATGTDVEGTIDGEAATGLGQTLSGNSGDTNINGLVIQYTGTATGSIGTVIVQQGLANQLNSFVTAATDPNTGSIASEETSLNSQLTAVQAQVTQMQTELSNYETQLQTEFANMESSVSALQTQQQAFTAEVNANSSTNSSSTSSSSATSSLGSSSAS